MKSVSRRPALSRVGATCHKGKPGTDPAAVVSVVEAWIRIFITLPPSSVQGFN
ncbi:MAG: hypothetical protein Q8K35_02895 [Thiobacillus sp.]|nr:hypothetical protein [Thiobacillus sp.]